MNKKLALLAFYCLTPFWFFAQVGVGTNTPDASAQLDVVSSSRGLLPPRIALTSLTDVTTVASPATGLMVFCTGTAGLEEGYYYWEGASWVKMSSSSNNLDLGYVVAWPSNTTPPGYLLPLSGGTFNWADYPEFQAFNATYASQFISSSNSTTFTLKDINSAGRFLRGSSTAGTDQDDATSLPTTAFTTSSNGNHTHTVDPENVTTTSNGTHNHSGTTSVNGSHWHTMSFNNDDFNACCGGNASLEDDGGGTYNRSTSSSGEHSHSLVINSNGAHTHSVDLPSTTSSTSGSHMHSITGGDSETRPTNTSVIWVLKVKPTSTTGNLTINNTYPGASSASNGISMASNNIKLGGTLSENTTIATAGNNLNITGAGAVGIGTSSPNASAALDISSSNKGVLLPRMTSSEMNAIASPATGLLLFCSDCAPVGFRFYNGSAWSEMMPVKQVALYNSSVYINANSNIVWGDTRYNAVSSANMVWSAGNTVCTLSNGKYLVEWGITRVQNDYTGIDLYLNSNIYRGGGAYARAENGGGTNWGGNSRRYAVIDATSSSQALLFKTDAAWGLNVGAELKIEKLD